MNLLKLPPMHLEARLPLELGRLLSSEIFHRRSDSGGGQPVMVIPGLMAGDESLRLLVGWLNNGGFAAEGSGIRVNVDCSEREMSRLSARLADISARCGGRPVLLIGHSRGGLFARALAHRHPHLVAGLITLGTPHLNPLNSMHPLLAAQVRLMSRIGDLGVQRIVSNQCRDGACCRDFWAQLDADVPRALPFVSVFTPSDGIVDFTACLHPDADCVAIDSSHCGMIANPDVFRALDEQLRALTAASAAVASAA